MSKFLLNLFVQIFKALVYLKIKFYSEKNFPVTFGPSGLSAQPRPIFSFQPAIFLPPPHWASDGPAHPHGPTDHLLLPPAPPPRSTTTPPPEEKKWPHQSPFIPPSIGAISPSSITGKRRLQPGPVKFLQRRPLKVLGLPRLASAL
jgi:hypothetical protein